MEALHHREEDDGITAPLVLGPDVALVPAGELAGEIRERIDCADDDIVISRAGGRAASRVVEARAVGLLERFREPRTIIEAVILHGRVNGEEPEQVLEDAFPLIRRLLADRVLVSAQEKGARDPLAPSLDTGARLLDVEVMRVLYLLEDTELYRVRAADGSFAVLKIRRPGAAELVGALAHEAAILRHLDGVVAPRLLDAGTFDERPYLLLEQCAGINPIQAAATGDRGQRLALGTAIAEAYAELHRRGVLHGDVHPGNVLVGRGHAVRLVDFGLARRVDGDAGSKRLLPGGGVPFHYPPEVAAALRSGGPPPPVTAASEQYALATLLYQLLTGARHLRFSLERDDMLRQIAEAEPLRFAELELEPWPEAETVLRRALARSPEARYASMAELAEALRGLGAPPPIRTQPAAASALERVRDRVLARAGLDGEWLNGDLPAPKASVTFGAAGLAYGLLHMAVRRDDPGLFALADLWAERAARSVGSDDGFYNSEIEIDRESVGESSPYHTPSGVFAVRALVARARADLGSWHEAVAAFLAAVEASAEGLDLTLGRSATLIAASLLLEALPRDDAAEAAPLRELGRGTVERVWRELDAMPAIPEAPVEYLGVAHGWAGFVYAALRWHQAGGGPLPAGVAPRLDELADLAQPEGRGLVWPVAPSEKRPFSTMPGWCNGAAGHVLLWTLAHRVLGRAPHLALAEGAGWEAWDDPGGYASLCCGLAGRAFALLALYRETGDEAWLARARALARRGALSLHLEENYPHSLYKGELGLAVLAVDLERPEDAAVPFFEA